jgi:hypothetical protein
LTTLTTTAPTLLQYDIRQQTLDLVSRLEKIPNYLLTVNADPKTIKGLKKGFLTGIQYLMPADGSGIVNLCPFASPGCKASCLNTAGQGDPRMGTTVQLARLTRTAYFQMHRECYMEMLMSETERLLRKADRASLEAVIRLNGTSDIKWESTPVRVSNLVVADNIMSLYKTTQFYDYTKWPYDKRPSEALPENYHLTFSLSEDNFDEAIHNLEMGRNVAAVFDTRKHEALPSEHMGYPVIDADDSDLRFLDPVGVWCGLRAKGYAKKDDSGFVIKVRGN